MSLPFSLTVTLPPPRAVLCPSPGERYSASVSAPVLVSATLHALQLTASGGGGTDGAPVPVDACVRVLRCALTCRAAHEDPVGAVLVELAQAAARCDRHERLLADILQVW